MDAAGRQRLARAKVARGQGEAGQVRFHEGIQREALRAIARLMRPPSLILNLKRDDR
jgi:hypothetical protein